MIVIRSMHADDAKDVLDIYKQGIETSKATFNTHVPTWEEWNGGHHFHSRLVAEDDGLVVGWVAISPVSQRECYKGVAEFSIYIDTRYRGRGIANMLMQQLVDESEANGIWTLYSSSFENNKASINLQLKFGFRVIGYREKIAMLGNTWMNTIVMERRSKNTGI